MKFEIIPTKGILYDKCENVEQLYDNYYYPLLVEFKQLQNNWNELKKWLEEQKEFLENIPTFTLEITHNHFGMVGAYKNTLGKMQELEQGKDEN